MNTPLRKADNKQGEIWRTSLGSYKRLQQGVQGLCVWGSDSRLRWRSREHWPNDKGCHWEDPCPSFILQLHCWKHSFNYLDNLFSQWLWSLTNSLKADTVYADKMSLQIFLLFIIHRHLPDPKMWVIWEVLRVCRCCEETFHMVWLAVNPGQCLL